jgi:hypothetical protein
MVGAGLPRTGTSSLKAALETLLGGPCYHMEEVFSHLDHAPLWQRALSGDPTGWQTALNGYVSAVDWPVSMFWREIAEANPHAVVLLSMRSDPRIWWESVDATIMRVRRGGVNETDPGWLAMAGALFDRFGLHEGDADGAMAAYERHNADVRATIPAARLVEWQPGDGWDPICSPLGVAVPAEPFPHRNTREDWNRDVPAELRN